MGITKIGIEGEQKLFKLLKKKGYSFFQPDSLGKKDGVWYLFECKQQERFQPPPFEGHGLPKWQVDARLEFEKDTGVIACLVVFDLETEEVFFAKLSDLEKGKYIDTKGIKPRRVYDIESFIKL